MCSPEGLVSLLSMFLMFIHVVCSVYQYFILFFFNLTTVDLQY